MKHLNDFRTKKLEKKEFEILTQSAILKRFKSEPPIQQIWTGIPERSIGLITGVAKTGKTTFTENLAMSLAAGRKSFWGNELIGKPLRVLYANLEETYHQRSPRNLKQERELSEEEYENYNSNYFVLDTDFPRFINTSTEWTLLRDYISKSKAEVIILDSLTHLYQGSIEESSVAQRLIVNIDEYIKPLGQTTIIVHHNVKGINKPITQDHIAGSRVITQEFDYAFGLAKTPYGDNYMCHLFNKYYPVDSVEVQSYKINRNQWLKPISKVNKFQLYDNKVDYRRTSKYREMIFDYIEQNDKKGYVTTTSQLVSQFLDSKVMAKDTLFANLSKLQEEGLIVKPEKGIYRAAKKKDDKELNRKKTL